VQDKAGVQWVVPRKAGAQWAVQRKAGAQWAVQRKAGRVSAVQRRAGAQWAVQLIWEALAEVEILDRSCQRLFGGVCSAALEMIRQKRSL